MFLGLISYMNTKQSFPSTGAVVGNSHLVPTTDTISGLAPMRKWIISAKIIPPQGPDVYGLPKAEVRQGLHRTSHP